MKTKFFMSGGGYAVSPRGILKLVQSLPCRERVCSMAVDWHMSMMIERGELNVYGFVPSLLKMPDQGWLHAYNIPAPSKEETEICESYVSDTHNEGQKTESQKVEELVDRWRSGKGLIGAYYGMEGSAIQGLASEDLPGVEVYRDWKVNVEGSSQHTVSFRERLIGDLPFSLHQRPGKKQRNSVPSETDTSQPLPPQNRMKRCGGLWLRHAGVFQPGSMVGTFAPGSALMTLLKKASLSGPGHVRASLGTSSKESRTT